MCNETQLKRNETINLTCLSFSVLLNSEVAIASLLRQTKQPKKFILEVKTITKAESVKSCNLHKKGRILWF
jgi:hypothetical protein